MQLSDLTDTIEGFASWKHVPKIKFFAWYLHAHVDLDRFSAARISGCYDELHLEKPSSVSPILGGLAEKTPKEVLRDGRGYYLAKQVRDEHESKFGARDTTIMVDRLLSELPGTIANEAERVFLNEALICFRHKAFRAAMVMTWNLAYAHFEEWIFTKHLAAFNTSLPIRYPRARVSAIITLDHFTDLKESEVIDVCRHANLISGSVHKILIEKLGKRNTAAHPSKVEISPFHAEEFICDLVTNVVLKLA